MQKLGVCLIVLFAASHYALAAPDQKMGGAEAQASAPARTIAPIVITEWTDAELAQVWGRWRAVEATSDYQAEAKARAELLATAKEVGAQDMDDWAMALIRASAEHGVRGDSGSSVEIAKAAVQLAPDLPAAWMGLVRAYAVADPSEIGRLFRTAKSALTALIRDPRYFRPAIGDLVIEAVLAFVALTIVVLLVLFIRSAKLMFFDFHTLFPKGVARWQTATLLVVLLVIPLVFRMGLAVELLAVFAGISVYLEVRERVVVAILIAILGTLPLIARKGVEASTFAGTDAEELYLLERGGHRQEPLARSWELAAAQDRLSFEGLYALGRHALRRGSLASALENFNKALGMRPNHLGTRVNLGLVFFLQGDLNNSRTLLESAVADSRDAIALFNLARVYQRRIAVLGDAAAGDVDKCAAAFNEAAALDPRLPRPACDEKFPEAINGNTLVKTYPLSSAEIAARANSFDVPDRVAAQVRAVFLGSVPEPIAELYPGLLALLIAIAAGLGSRLKASHECLRCGRPVSHRTDPDLPPRSAICSQCVSVFSERSVASPALRVRKQLEIARYHARAERIGLIFGALWSGMGHIFTGAPVRGVLAGGLFALLAAGLILWRGALRTPYGDVTAIFYLVPLGLVMIVVYFFTYRGLTRRLR